MFFLDIDFCCDAAFLPFWNLVGTVVKIIWIGVPILLIILGMVDLGKAVIASKEDEIKKATKSFGKRFLYAVGVFLVVWIVTLVFSLMTEIFPDTEYNQSSWQKCWNVIVNGNCYGTSGNNNGGGTGGGGGTGTTNPGRPNPNPSYEYLQ